jgi:hypothetical protein
MPPARNVDESKCEQPDSSARAPFGSWNDDASHLAGLSRDRNTDRRVVSGRVSRRALPLKDAFSPDLPVGETHLLSAEHLQVPARATLLQARARMHRKFMPSKPDVLSPRNRLQVS